jgi:hypothetical protein
MEGFGKARVTCRHDNLFDLCNKACNSCTLRTMSVLSFVRQNLLMWEFLQTAGAIPLIGFLCECCVLSVCLHMFANFLVL